MVNGSTATTITMRLVKSKLLKRDENRGAIEEQPPPPPANDDDDQHRAQSRYGNANETTGTTDAIKQQQHHHHHHHHQHVTFVRTSGVSAQPVERHAADVTDIAEWTFPPKAPVPHIYHINPELMVANEKLGFKGFRKQFSGRFKRLVARKPEPAPVIPPELKPQLKTIYVY